MAKNHGRSAIFADGELAPLVTTLAASKSFSRSIEVTKPHDMTLAGGAYFSGGIFLAAAAVGRALKGSMVGERMNKSFGREVREKEMS
jgi:H+/Cl- antiporter ClcA